MEAFADAFSWNYDLDSIRDFKPNDTLNKGECIRNMLIIAHGSYSINTGNEVANIDIGSTTLTESANNFCPGIGKTEISDIFKGVKFCKPCTIELRSCEIGQMGALKTRLEKNTGCDVVLYPYNVNPFGYPPLHLPTPAPPSNPYCFESGTLVAAPNGATEIQDLRPGETVYSYDLNRQEVVESKVLKCHWRDVEEILELCISTNLLRTTAEHPFYVVGKGWIKAASLTEGDRLLTKDDQVIELSGVRRIVRRTRVYNLSVEGDENYFVGPNQVLVHNKPAF